jgi:phosphoglycerate kinase
MALTLELIEKAKAKGVKLYLPVDSKIADQFANEAQTNTTASNAIPDGWMGLDIGPEAIKTYAEVLRKLQNHFMERPDGRV